MASIIKKKIKRQAPLARLCASERAKQFSGDLYADGNILFCKFCEHNVDFKRVDTVKDHLESKKHVKNKSDKIASDKAKSDGDGQPPAKRQVTLLSAFRLKDLREEFILDFVRLCTMADIPLEKAEKMRPFMRKHCKQGGTLPQAATLRSLYVPRQFQVHFSALKQAVQGRKVSIITDETTDVRDHSILNVVAGVHGKYFLIDVCTMEACNHSTLSASVIKAVTSVGIDFTDVIAVVTDSAAYCKKAAREVLQPIFPNSCHVRCLAHIINLSAEVFQLWPEFDRVATLVKMMKSVFFKKPACKTRFLKFLKDYLPKDQVKLPPVPFSTRCNSWFNAVMYHSAHVHEYHGFFKKEESKGMAVEQIIELTNHKEIYPELRLYMSFIKENCSRLMSSLTSLEATHDPLACTVYNTIGDQSRYLHSGTTKTSFGDETDAFIKAKPLKEQKAITKTLQAVFQAAFTKLEGHIEQHPAFPIYKAARIFDPRQLGSLSHDISEYQRISGLEDPTPATMEEWLIYMNLNPSEIPTPLNIATFWEDMAGRFPNLSTIAKEVMWMPVASVDVERSFSQYKHLLNDRRESLTQQNTKMLAMMYFNGDIEDQFA